MTCNKISMAALVNTSITSYVIISFLCWEQFRPTLSNLEVYNIILLFIITEPNS